MNEKIDYTQYQLTMRKQSKLSSKEDIAKLAAPKLAQVLFNVLHVGPRIILRSAYMILRANIITRIISAAVLMIFDTISFVRKRISLRQYFINITLALSLLFGGTAGWYAGEYFAAWVMIENVVLGFVVAIIGAGLFGWAAGFLAEKVINRFFKDDSHDMLVICNQVFCELAQKYQLSPEQAEKAVGDILINKTVVRQMYSSLDKAAFAHELISPCLKEICAIDDCLQNRNLYLVESVAKTSPNKK